MATHRDSIRSDRNAHQTSDVLPPQVLKLTSAERSARIEEMYARLGEAHVCGVFTTAVEKRAAKRLAARRRAERNAEIKAAAETRAHRSRSDSNGGNDSGLSLRAAAALLVYHFQTAAEASIAPTYDAAFFVDYIGAWQAAGLAETADKACGLCRIAAERTRYFLMLGTERRAALRTLENIGRALTAEETAEIVNRAAIEAALTVAEEAAARLL